MTSKSVLTSEAMKDTQGGAAEASPSQNLPRKRKLEETSERILNEEGKQVKLANSPPVMIDCVSPYYSHDEEGIDAAEAARRKALIWHSRNDYQSFLKDRVATIRVYRSMRGELAGLEEYYCLRGLEPYLSPSLHAEVLAHRTVYVQAVLDEQRREKLRSVAGSQLNFMIPSPDLEQMSEWAMDRALRLGEMDALEAEKVYKGETAVISKPRRKMSRRQSTAGVSKARVAKGNKQRCLAAMRRDSLQTSSFRNTIMTMASDVLSPEYDLAKLKEMNRRLLERMCSPVRNVQVAQRSHPQQQQSLKQAPAASEMSLNSLLRAGNDDEQCPNNKVGGQLHLPPYLPTGRRCSALSRRLLQEQQAALQMVRRDSLHTISDQAKASL